MKCEVVYLENGPRAIVCGSQRSTARTRCKCGAPSASLCDWIVLKAAKNYTCDRALCANCAKSPAPGKHLCPEHWDQWQVDPRNPLNKGRR